MGNLFAWLADADVRLGPVLEAIVDGKYYWIPFGNLSAITSRSRPICATWPGYLRISRSPMAARWSR
jgi:protein involved in temperature-dependent protein secretion